MKTLITVFLSLLLAGVVTGKHVTYELARLVAINQYRHYLESGYTDLSITDSFEVEYNGLVTYFVFNFNAGGFVLVAADDAVTPILGYSYEGYCEKDISNPAVTAWFDSYSMEIYHIIQARLDNTSTLREWNDIRESRFKNQVRILVRLFPAPGTRIHGIISFALLMNTARVTKP